MAIEIYILTHGISALFIVILTFILGLKIIMAYFKFHNKNFILVGIAWIGFSSGFLSEAINFILISTNNATLPFWFITIIEVGTLPLYLILWLIAIVDLLGLKTKNRIILLFAIVIFCVVFEIIYSIDFNINLDNIGGYQDNFSYIYTDLYDSFYLVLALIILISGILFGRECLKSKESEIKLKGKLLIIAFTILATTQVFEGFIFTDPLSIAIIRIALAFSSITFYAGFLLPNWIKKIFLKK